MAHLVVILAQGEQKRIPELKIPKQLVSLPACGNMPILDRTLRMVYSLRGAETSLDIVGWPHFVDHYKVHPIAFHYREGGEGWSHAIRPNVVTLDDPGNSSLKGMNRYLLRPASPFSHDSPYTQVTMLLGDVIYSWDLLYRLLMPLTSVYAPRFAVSSDISGGGGELWGITWRNTDPWRQQMIEALEAAMRSHPQQTIYQPGQMRLWLWAYERLNPQRNVRIVSAPDDYIIDIDKPEHTTPAFLQAISERAAHDDGQNMKGRR